jgi:hypothetical protein
MCPLDQLDKDIMQTSFYPVQGVEYSNSSLKSILDLSYKEPIQLTGVQ